MPPIVHHLPPILLLGLWLLWTAAAWAAASVTLVLSDSSTAYLEAANSLRQALEREDQRWRLRVEPLAARHRVQGEDLVIPMGLRALRAVLAEPGHAPVWALMVTRAEYESVAAGPAAASRRPLSALFLDQPASRQIQMLLAALPDTKSLGVITSGDDASMTGPLREAAAARGLNLAVERVERYGDVIAMIENMKGRIDLLLLLPDPLVVDAGTLRPLLLETYRHRLPVMAYSTPLVAAGAMLAVYASPERIGREAAMRLSRAGKGGPWRLPPPGYVDDFEVAVNRSVALALDIRVPTSELIRRRMARHAGP